MGILTVRSPTVHMLRITLETFSHMSVLQAGCLYYLSMFIVFMCSTETLKIASFCDERGIMISELGVMALGDLQILLLFKNLLIKSFSLLLQHVCVVSPK